MDLGTLLVLLAVILAAVSIFVETFGARLLTVAVLLGFIGVLVSNGGVTT